MGRKKIDHTTPYAERLNIVRGILGSLKGPDQGLVSSIYQPPEEATTPTDALKLYKDITAGTHPATEEGVVIHPPTGVPMKSKLLGEHDVWIRGLAPGKMKWQDRGAGAFSYSHEPDGPIVGEVGTGLSDTMRQDAFQNPADYIGRVARVRASRKLPSGALFQPSLLALHEG